jgi:hypothetical protein
MTHFLQQRDRLQPAETFFDSFPLSLADGIARVARGARIDAFTRLNRNAFEQDLRRAIGRKLASKVNATNFQTLFEISDENLRTYNAIHSINREKLIQDWNHRSTLIARIKTKVETLEEYLKEISADKDWPNTALLAGSIHERLGQFQDRLNREFESIKHHQRLSQAMLKALSLKAWGISTLRS